ncbi:holo-[acyl-carrier-protein] synthase [Synergistales bacterium]|nr:holo-[acyl-carrier-protein] synthase [Synergistales bacterium]
MIVGIGTDICKISRMRRAVQNKRFIERLFSEEEIEYAHSGGDSAEHFAGAFAAKEALAKATGLGMFGIGLTNASVRRTESGPIIVCGGDLQEKLEALGADKCWLSLSHDGDYAIAFVVLEKN